MKASFVSVDLTGPHNLSLAGYFEREPYNLGVHDPVYEKIVIFENEGQYFALGSGDYIGVDKETRETVRQRVFEETNIPKENIVLCATHTHSSYSATNMTRVTRNKNKATTTELAYHQLMMDKIVGGFLQAFNSMEDVDVGYGVGQVYDVGRNRNHQEGYFDPSVHVVRFNRLDGSLLGSLVSYGCHPTVLNYKNYYVSSDYVGYMRQTIESMYPGSTCIFIQGASGEVSTRFTRRGQDFTEAKRLGLIVAGEVLKVLNTIENSNDWNIQSTSPSIRFLIKEFESLEVLEQRIQDHSKKLELMKETKQPQEAIRKQYVTLQGTQFALLNKQNIDYTSIDSVLQITKFGPFNFVGIPGEPFGEIAKDIQEIMGQNTMVVGYCNEFLGYFVSDQAQGHDGYEKFMTPYDNNTHQNIVEAVRKAVESL